MPLALRPWNTQYDETAWWVHLDNGEGEPLCGERKQGYGLIREVVAADYPHVCELCRDHDEQHDLLDTDPGSVV